jgi:hypothetical protein
MNDLPAPTDEHKALKATVLAGRLVVAAGLVFLFIQLFADIVAAARGCDGRVCGSLSSYPVGIVMLMIGSALLVTAIVASRPRPAAVADQPATPIQATAPAIRGSEQPLSSMPTKIALTFESGLPAEREEKPQKVDETG